MFNQTKEQLKQLVTNLSGIGQNTVVGIGTMAGTTTTSHLNGDSRLGGYINYIQEPILVREFAVELRLHDDMTTRVLTTAQRQRERRESQSGFVGAER